MRTACALWLYCHAQFLLYLRLVMIKILTAVRVSRHSLFLQLRETTIG